MRFARTPTRRSSPSSRSTNARLALVSLRDRHRIDWRTTRGLSLRCTLDDFPPASSVGVRRVPTRPRIHSRAGSSTTFHISHAMTRAPTISTTTPTAYNAPDSIPATFIPARHKPIHTRWVM